VILKRRNQNRRVIEGSDLDFCHLSCLMMLPRKVSFPDDNHLAVRLSGSHFSSEFDAIQEGLWYSASDFGAFRCTSRIVASECKMRGIGNFLASADAGSGESFELLVQWAKYRHSARGLERLCNESHGCNRERQRWDCIRSVLMTQEVLRQHSGIHEDIKSLIVAKVSAKYSEHARWFASRMGLADACAVSTCRSTTSRNFQVTFRIE
jgi:hypothetical protein